MKNKNKTKVVNISDIKRAIGMKGPLGTLIAACAMRGMGFCKINTLYSEFAQYKGKEFTEGLLKTFNIKYDIIPSQLEYFPQEGPFIIVSNHPFGGIDGVILYNTVSSIRPEFKILTNFILSHIPNLKDSFLPVNPFSDMKGLKKSFSGIRAAREHVENGGALALFPAGEVSTYYHKKKYIEDKEWQPAMIKLIKSCNVPVIPVYFDGTNSKKFHFLGRINPILRTIRLPKELLNKCGKTITMRIGKPISPSELAEYSDLKELGLYLKSRSYALEANLERNKPVIKEQSGEIVPLDLPIAKKLLLKEIQSIEKDSLLFDISNYQCFLADHNRIPSLMHEIGLRREESFRAVGEGTNHAIDVDKYDDYYKHMILWDKQKERIAGAYRLGIGCDIIKEKGIKGFYTNELFDYSESFSDVLSQSIELGRSFVSLAYQKEALPLMLLIKGLMYCLMKYTDCQYFIGPASISSWYPYFYRSAFLYYLTNKHSTPLSDLVKARHPFSQDFLRVDSHALLDRKMESVEKFDRYMLRLSDNEYRLPTLIKKYLKLGASILAFNVDKDFNYCVDGLILVKVTNIPEEELRSLSKGGEDIEEVMKRFGYGTGS